MANVTITEFHSMDPDLLQKALGILVKRGKAQVFGQEMLMNYTRYPGLYRRAGYG